MYVEILMINKLAILFNFIQIIHSFLKTNYISIVFIVLINIASGLLLGARPLSLAPVLGRIIPSDVSPANSLSQLSLDNISVTLMHYYQIDFNSVSANFLFSAALFSIFTLLIVVANFSGGVWSITIRLRILQRMIGLLHNHLINLPLSFFSYEKPGSLVSRFTSDLVVSSRTIEIMVRGVVQSAIQTSVYLFILFNTDPTLTFKVLAIGLFHIIMTRFMGDFVKKRSSGYFDSLAELTSKLIESFQAIRIIKSFAVESYQQKKICNESDLLIKNMYRYQFAVYVETPVRILIDGFITVATFYLCYSAISANKLSMTGVAMYFFLVSQLMGPISELSKHLLSIWSIQGSLNRLLTYFNEKTTLGDCANSKVNFKESIEFQNVTFGYKNGKEVLKDISLKINKGQKVVLVGDSGGGKSTILDLMLRFIDPIEGKILLDGVDIRCFNSSLYRMKFGVVHQDCMLFNTTIGENITLGREYDKNKLRKVCEIANILDFIELLPEQFQSVVGDRGTEISGGQRQRIAIARALYGEPEILLLDEATNALDNKSEREVQNAIQAALINITGIVVSHRLTTIRKTDLIFVISEGKILDFGMHNELMKRCEKYQLLYKLQYN